DFGPYGRARDERVEQQVGIEWVGSPYAVDPGVVRKGDGTPFTVFTPFSRAWRDHGWDPPADVPRSVPWASGVRSGGITRAPRPHGVELPEAGERAAQRRLDTFVDGPLRDYADRRDRPAEAGTSGLSPYLKWGAIHPRTVLAAAASKGRGAATFESEVA